MTELTQAEKEYACECGAPVGVACAHKRGPTEMDRTYKLVTISMYNADVDELERKVAELKGRGIRRANKSWLIRVALARLDVATVTDKDRP